MTALDLADPVAVVGTGTMGEGIAQVALVAGHPVRRYDAVPGRARAAAGAIGARLDRLAEGPFEWSRRVGKSWAYEVLDEMHLRDRGRGGEVAVGAQVVGGRGQAGVPSGRYAPSLALYRHAYASEKREGTP